SEAMAIQRFLRGELFRDSNDLVITGNVDSYRTTLRFSQDEYTPGVNIRMEVPATFDLAIAPKNAESGITGSRSGPGTMRSTPVGWYGPTNAPRQRSFSPATIRTFTGCAAPPRHFLMCSAG